MIGQKFNRLTVLELIPERNRFCKKMFRCRCDCGSEGIYIGVQVKNGRTKSCGCIKGVAQTLENARHKHPLYRTWTMMRQRCNNLNHSFYKYYGGKGIKVCDEWEKDFYAFVTYMGDRPEGCTVDRIENTLGYQPGNVKWSTKKEQANNRSNNVRLRREVASPD